MTARVPRGDLAIVFGSGLAVVPEGAEVIDEIDYARLGWPTTSVAGHPNRLLVARWAPGRRAALRVLLACGRPHLYEGWSAAELARPVDDLAAAGALDPSLRSGDAVVVTEVVDLQNEPTDQAPVLPVLDPTGALRLATALAPLQGRAGRYVAVPGPHYETPAEAAWLRDRGEVVGMSTAAEVRAAHRFGVPVCVLSLVANASGAALGHADVLAVGARLAAALGESRGAFAAAFLSEIDGGPGDRGAQAGGAT